MARRHPYAGGLALLVILALSVGIAAAPSVSWHDDQAVAEVAPGERARGFVEPSATANAPPIWLLPAAAGTVALLGTIAVAAALERNPPARFASPGHERKQSWNT